MQELDIFIKGETIDLCIPTREFAKGSNWYKWFNNPKITKYLEQGFFPNTVDKQENFFVSQKNDRMILIISNKSKYLGVVSLSKINLIKKTCDLAIVVDSSMDKRGSPYISLEAIALITVHAFEVIGINRISAGQHKGLEGWAQRMGLLGYIVEGIHTNKYIKARDICDSITIACVYETYKKIIKQRGSLWDSKEKFKQRYKNMPKETFTKELENFFRIERTKYYDNLFNL
ncbi:MAG: GNAT family N-acetyltransferase [Gammaproteobacteria bacterium]|nr:GNAT family N-acetyltransferase [Gammaproteobacteria bacterium]